MNVFLYHYMEKLSDFAFRSHNKCEMMRTNFECEMMRTNFEIDWGRECREGGEAQCLRAFAAGVEGH
jgi:hypothetical protein